MRNAPNLIIKQKQIGGIINAVISGKCWTPRVRMTGWFLMISIRIPLGKIPKELEICLRLRIQWRKNLSGNLSRKKRKNHSQLKIQLETPLLLSRTAVKTAALTKFFPGRFVRKNKWLMLMKRREAATVNIQSAWSCIVNAFKINSSAPLAADVTIVAIIDKMRISTKKQSFKPLHAMHVDSRWISMGMQKKKFNSNRRKDSVWECKYSKWKKVVNAGRHTAWKSIANVTITGRYVEFFVDARVVLTQHSTKAKNRERIFFFDFV